MMRGTGAVEVDRCCTEPLGFREGATMESYSCTLVLWNDNINPHIYSYVG